MPLTGTQIVDIEDHILSTRLVDFLKAQFPQGSEKALAREIGCDPRTAKNILNHYWPSARHLRAIVRRFGQDVVTAVFTPDIEPEAARLNKEVRRLEEQLAQARARRRQITGGRDGVQGRVASSSAGAPSAIRHRA